MAEKRRGLGRGLGALIPTGVERESRPIDVFFPGAPEDADASVVHVGRTGSGPARPRTRRRPRLEHGAGRR